MTKIDIEGLRECKTLIKMVAIGDGKAAVDLCQRIDVAVAELERRNKLEHVAPDGTTRKSHYGSGRQPWDDIKEAGWGPEFCAGNVLKYLRRDKDLAHSLESARVYFSWLKDLALMSNEWQLDAAIVYAHLCGLLTTEEHMRLHP